MKKEFAVDGTTDSVSVEPGDVGFTKANIYNCDFFKRAGGVFVAQ